MENNIKIKLYGNITARKYDSIDELFQRKKFNELIKIFNHNLDMNIDDKMSITNTRTHDTIFVSGDRGSGKTAFMLNIKSYIENVDIKKILKDENIDKDLDKKLKFFTPIDPTLLEDTESFLSVVLAKLVEEINNYLKTSNDDKLKKEYFGMLQQLSESLKAIKTLKDDKGIDEITSNKSSLKLEENAHKFFGLVCKIFKVERLVVLIDDVDMAFERGFDVLEVVRKYLASPYLIPIVAGDYDLYEKIVKNHFMNKTEFDKEIDIIDKCYDNKLEKYLKQKVFVDNLTEQYLQKVFPSEYRVILDDIKSIVDKEEVEVSISENDEDKKFTDIKEFEINHINLGINREAYKYNPISYNARLFVQYLTRKKDIYEEFLIKNKDYNDINNLQKSYEITSEFYKFSIDDKKKFLSQLLKNDVDSFENGKYNLYKAFKNLDKFLENKEKIDEDFYITKNTKNQKYLKQTLNNISLDDIEKLMLKIFTYEDYVSSYQKRLFLVAGKFLEIMSLSLRLYEVNLDKTNFQEQIKNYKELTYPDNFEKENEELIKNIYNELTNILYSKPFGIHIENTKKSQEVDEEIDNYVEVKDEEIKKLVKDILLWNSYFISKNYLSSVSMIEIIKKFFENINEIKSIYILKKIDAPYNFFIRTIISFVNSIAFFENDNNKVSTTNVALSRNINFETFVSKDNSYKLNIKPLLEKDSLTKALFFHPIISFFVSEEGNNIKQLVKNIEELGKIEKEILEGKVIEYLTSIGFDSTKGTIPIEDKIKILSQIINDFENKNIDKKELELIYKMCKSKCLNKKTKNETLLNLIKKMEEYYKS